MRDRSARGAKAALRLSLLLSSASGVLALPVSAHAQEAAPRQDQRTYDIPAQPLASAVRRYMRQSGVQVGYPSGLDARIMSRPVNGKMSAAEALSRLLEGTGLTYRFTGPGTATLEAAPQAAADGSTISLGTLRVEGSSAVSTAGGARDGHGGTDGATAPYRTAGSSAYRSAAEIQRFRGTSPGDFLSGIPGVINGENRNSGAIDVNIRGLQGMDRVPVVIDGSLQQSTVYRGYSGVAGRTYLDPDLVGSVTIEKGPSAAADGVGATGGVVRVNTINVDDLVAKDGGFGVQVRASLTGNNVDPPAVGTLGTGNGGPARFDRPGLLSLNGWNFSVAAAQRLGKIDLVAAVARRKIGNYFGGEHGAVPPGGTNFTGGVLNRYNLGEEVLSTSQDNTSILLRTVIRPNPDMALDLSYIRYESDFGEMMPSQIIRFGGAMESPLSRTEVNTYTGRFRWNPGESHIVDLKLDAWATDNFTRIITLNRYTFPNGTVLNQDSAYMSQSNRWGANLSNASHFATPLGALDLSYGASYTHERLTPPKAWEEYKKNSGYSNFMEPRNGWRYEYSAFVAGELKPYPWMTVNGSLRFTASESQDKNLVNIQIGSGPDYYYVSGYNHEKSSGFAPMASLLIEPFSGVQIYGSYAEAIRAPSLFESTTGFSFYPDPRYRVQPERARNVEIGLNLDKGSVIRTGDLLQAKLAFFHNNVDNYITRTPGEDGFPTDVRNIDRAEFQGFEVSGHYDAGAVYADIGTTLYTYRQFCDKDGLCREGNTTNSYVPAAIPPQYSFTASLGTRLFDDRLNLGARYTHMSSRNVNFSTFGGSMTVIEWGPYDLFDLFGSFRINDNLSFDMAIDNLTDRYYTDALSLGLMPSPGRTFRVGVTSGFGGPKRQSSEAMRERAVAAALGRGAPHGEFTGDWAGPYLGVFAGHGWVASRGTTTAGDGTPGGIPASESAHVRASGAQVGLYGGGNMQFGHVVAGLEGDFGLSKTRTSQYAVSSESVVSTSYPPDTRYQAGTLYDFKWLATARARLGYATGNLLVYGTGGAAFLRESERRTQYRDTAAPQNLGPDRRYGNFTAPVFSETAERTRTGWTAGGGMEFALGNHWSLKAEYLYARFGRSDFNFANARAGVGAPYSMGITGIYIDPTTGQIGINPATGDYFTYDIRSGTGDTVTGRRARNDAEVHSLRLGIGFRF